MGELWWARYGKIGLDQFQASSSLYNAGGQMLLYVCTSSSSTLYLHTDPIWASVCRLSC